MSMPSPPFETEREHSFVSEGGGQTKIISGRKNVELLTHSFLERAKKSYLKGLTDDRFPKNADEALNFIKGMFSANPNFKIQLIADIQKENLHYYKLLQEAGAEIRHVERNKVSFALSEDEYLSAPISALEQLAENGDEIPTEMVWSSRQDLISQADQIFQVMWKSAITSGARIAEIENRKPHVETRIVRDSQEVLSETRRMAISSKKYSVCSVPGGLLYAHDYALSDFEKILERFRKGEHEGIRWLTTIDNSTKDVAKQFVELGMQLRHLPNVPTESFGFSEKEVGVTVSRLEGGRMNSSALFSNDQMYIDHYTNVFESLWEDGLDAQMRIKQIEQGIDEPEIKIIRNKNEIETTYLNLIKNAINEIMLLLPTTNDSLRMERSGIAHTLAMGSERRVKTRILTPRFLNYKANDYENAMGTSYIETKLIPETISPESVTLLVVDRSTSLIIELDDDSSLDFEKAIGLATYSTRGSTVRANTRFFERIWQAVGESERERVLLESERRSRMEAELLQDILTHDIRNYNQASRTGAEFILEQVKGRTELESVANTVIRAIDGSTSLIDKAKKLGMILSTGKRELRPVNLIESIDRSLVVARESFPTKQIKETRKIVSIAGSTPKLVQVLADDLIDEIFTNLFSNSIKFSQGPIIPLDIQIVEKESLKQSYWQVTIADYGPGIASSDMGSIFHRYSKGQKGSGLGLSIVQALVELYGGSVSVQNRSDGPTGAIFEVNLLKY